MKQSDALQLVLESLEDVSKRLVLLEFPTIEAARAWHASEDYAPAKALRQATSTGDMVVIEGV